MVRRRTLHNCNCISCKMCSFISKETWLRSFSAPSRLLPIDSTSVLPLPQTLLPLPIGISPLQVLPTGTTLYADQSLALSIQTSNRSYPFHCFPLIVCVRLFLNFLVTFLFSNPFTPGSNSSPIRSPSLLLSLSIFQCRTVYGGVVQTYFLIQPPA